MHLKLWPALGLFLLIFFSSCKVNQGPISNGEQPSSFEFIVLQLNDVYEIAPLEGGKSGGLARVATVLKELKAENPNTFSVLAGDFFSPSFMGNLKMDNGEKIAGLQMIETLNAMGLDYATFGNHEFDFSDPDLVQKRVNASSFQYMSANVRRKQDNGQTAPFNQMVNGQSTPVPDYLIHTVKNNQGQTMKVAIVGTTLPFNQQPYLHYLDWKSAFIAASEKAQAEADLVLGLTHLNLDQDMDLAASIKDVPLFMGGHEHDSRTRYVEETIITKAFANARTVYVHRIKYDPISKMSKIRSSVVPIDDKIADEPETAKVVDRWQSQTAAAIEEMGYDANRVIYNTSDALIGTEVAIRSQQTNYGQLTCQSYEYVWPGADLYVLNGGSLRVDDNLVGDITEYDILRSFPFGGGVSKVTMNGTQLTQLLETGTVTNQGEGGYLQIWGAKKEGGNWQIQDKSIIDTQSYQVVMPSFLASGREANLGFLGELKAEDKKGFVVNDQTVENDVRDIIIAYLSQTN